MHFRPSVTVRCLTLALLFTGAQHAQGQQPPATKEELSLLAIGDWGIDAPARLQVGEAMAEYAVRGGHRVPDAALLLGDNFYVKLTGTDDPQIQSFFEKTYDPVRLPIPFYTVMGNHDYKQKNVSIEMDYAKNTTTRLKIPARWYRLDLPAEKPLVTILMLDSDAPQAQLMEEADWKAETEWLTAELAKPHAKWLMAAAHHDIFGNGSHGDNGVLMTTWGEMFKQAKLDLYLCGHEHTLQHLEIPNWPISFVIAGGGGAKTKPMLRDQRGPFSRSVNGFASLSFSQDAIMVRLIDVDGTILHEFNRTADGQVNITVNSPSDKATTKPLQVIQGIDDSKKSGKSADDKD